MKLECQIAPPISSLIDELESMKAGLGAKGLRSALVYGAKPLKDKVKALAPEHRGNLKKAVGHTTLSKSAKSRLGVPKESVALLVGANRKIAINGKKYWQGKKAHWLEEGTENMRARPFLQPALASAGGQMEPRFYAGLTKYLESQRAKRNPQ